MTQMPGENSRALRRFVTVPKEFTREAAGRRTMEMVRRKVEQHSRAVDQKIGAERARPAPVLREAESPSASKSTMQVEECM